MTSQHDKPKRWRPKFSVRTMVIVVTLVCCYAACWGPTKSNGTRQISWLRLEMVRTTPIAPLLIAADDEQGRRDLYFWFFGYVAKLPFEREIDTIPLIPFDSPRGTSKQVIRHEGQAGSCGETNCQIARSVDA